MRTATIQLDKGITVGEVQHITVVLKEPSAMDVINAMKASEQLVTAPVLDEMGQTVRMEAQFIASPTATAIHVMLSQIVSIGTEGEKPLYSAPIPERILDKLSPNDLNILQREAALLENASVAEVAARGRPDAESEDTED
jgi:phage FluMu protein gp41